MSSARRVVRHAAAARGPTFPIRCTRLESFESLEFSERPHSSTDAPHDPHDRTVLPRGVQAAATSAKLAGLAGGVVVAGGRGWAVPQRVATDLLNLIVEVTGERKKDNVAKVATARTLWVPAVNNHADFGRWAFIEIADPWETQGLIRALLRGTMEA